jgi:predicted nucleotidyltransferase/biotin operon repressor
MDMYKLKFTKLQNKIFRLLCIKAGSSLSQREIAKLLGVSPTAIGKSVREMLKDGLVKIKRKGNLKVNFIELNRDDLKAIELKRVENLKMVYESGLADFLEEKFPGSTIILFGSYSRGEDTIKSDIDIAVIGREEKEINLKVFERVLERKIIINFYPSLKEIHKDLRENICNGIVLSGSIQL